MNRLTTDKPNDNTSHALNMFYAKDGQAFIATPLCVGFLEHVIPIDDCGKRFEAYRRPPKEVTGRWRQREMEAPNG